MNWVIIGSDNGLSPDWRQAIIWVNTRILLIGPFTNFNEIRIKMINASFMKMHLKMSAVKWCPFCPGEDVFARVVVFDQQYIVKPLKRNTSLNNVVRGSIKPVRLLQSSLLHKVLLCSCKSLRTIDMSLSHTSYRRYSYPYNSNDVCCWNCFTWENCSVPYLVSACRIQCFVWQ